MSEHAELHPSLQGLAGLVGSFEGEGHGDYPTIDAFGYREHITFDHVGAPVLVYRQRTRSMDGVRPMHAESGFLRSAGDDRVEWTLAHSFGIVELLEGTWDGEVLRMSSTAVESAGTAKRVEATRRELRLDGAGLVSDLWMSYGGHADTHHLRSLLRRTDS